MALDETYSLSYQTTRLGTLCNGYRLTISGEDPKIDGAMKHVSTGVLISEGTTLRRDYEAKTKVYADPLFQILNKMIIFYPNRSTLSDNSGASIMSHDEFTKKIAIPIFTGDIEKVFETLIGSHTGIDFDYKDSSITAALKDANGGRFNGKDFLKSKTMNQAIEVFTGNNMVSIMDVLQMFLPALGLDIYWVGESRYSVEPPRIMEVPSSPKKVKDEDIISKTIGSDVFNLPDVVIPRFAMPNSINSQTWLNSQTVGLSAVSGTLAGSDNLKISTFDIPPLITGAYKAAYKTADNGRNLTTGVMTNVFKDTEDMIYAFYEGIGYSSSMYGMVSGTVELIYQPDIMIPASWYNIGGENLFISDIRHEVTRFRAVTILTVAGTEDSLPIKNAPKKTKKPASSPAIDKVMETAIKAIETADEKEKEEKKKSAKENKESITKRESKKGVIIISNMLPVNKKKEAIEDTVHGKNRIYIEG